MPATRGVSVNAKRAVAAYDMGTGGYGAPTPVIAHEVEPSGMTITELDDYYGPRYADKLYR